MNVRKPGYRKCPCCGQRVKVDAQDRFLVHDDPHWVPMSTCAATGTTDRWRNWQDRSRYAEHDDWFVPIRL